MAKLSGKEGIERELGTMLSGRFPGMTVSIASQSKWNRPVATFVWSGFAGLLPEERFHRLMTVIPEAFREKHLPNFVWLELATGETVDDLFKLPRSDDIAGRELEVFTGLDEGGFFKALRSELGTSPKQACSGEFRETLSLLKRMKLNQRAIQDAKLAFIRLGAYCDCQALECAKSTGKPRAAARRARP